MQKAICDLALTTIAFTPKYAVQVFSLPAHHRDPLDRMIIATALSEDIPVIGGNREFKLSSGHKVVW